jgi:GNAT superfamily N-acetyltransferase
MILRSARREDIGAMHAVRMSVRENRLTSITLDESDYERAIGVSGKGWVIEVDGQIVAFSVGNATNGNIWALFVHPDHEGRGHGRRLLEAVVEWLWNQGPTRLWLTTLPGTRAEGFYESAGWQRVALLDSGELKFELRR